MKYGIRVNDQYLELGKVKMSLYLTNPMFEELGTFSYTFKIPNTPTNREILGHPSIENFDDTNTYDCMIMGPFRMAGQLKLKEITEESFKAYFTAGNGEFHNIARDKFLTDIEDEDYIFDDFTTYKSYLDDTIDHTIDERDFVIFPIKNSLLFEGLEDSLINYWNNPNYYDSYINHWDFPNNQFDSTWCLRYPQFYLGFVLEKLFGTFGYALSENPFRDISELKTLILISPFYRDPIYALQSYRTSGSNILFNINEFMPHYPVLDFVKGLDVFGMIPFINHSERTVQLKFIKDILSASDFIDITNEAEKNKEYEPEAEEDGFKLAYEFDSADEAVSEEVKEILNFNRGEDVDTEGDLPIPGTEEEIRLVKDANAFFIYTWDTGEAGWIWKQLSKNLNQYLNGDEDYQMISEVSPLVMKILSSTLYDVSVPYYEIPGFDIEEHPLADEGSYWNVYKTSMLRDILPRLIFYRGKITNASGYHYPYATIDKNIYFWNGASYEWTNIGATMTLSFHGDYGIYETFWKDYLYWYLNLRKLEERVIHFTHEQIEGLDFSKKYRIGNQNYLIKKISLTIDFSNHRFEFKETELYTV